MSIFATIDTNVLVSALLSKKSDTATVKIIKAVMDGDIIPLLHDDIISEYEDVLYRDKFHLRSSTIQTVIQAFKTLGQWIFPKHTGETFIEPDDLIFYEVTMAKREDNSFLVTGNLRHYPNADFIVTPAQMLAILKKSDNF